MSNVPVQQANPALHNVHSIWSDVNGSLTSLQWCGGDDDKSTLQDERGFRRFVVKAANSLGITGFILRYTKSNVELFYEGTDDQMASFGKLLAEWKRQGMVGEDLVKEAEDNYFHRHYADFSIHENFTNLASTGRRHGIVAGEFSDDLQHFEKQSVSSADSFSRRA